MQGTGRSEAAPCPNSDVAAALRPVPCMHLPPAAPPFPSPPLEERDRERRPSFSANPPALSARQPVGRSCRPTAPERLVSLLSPALSSKGGEGEPFAGCSRLLVALEVDDCFLLLDPFGSFDSCCPSIPAIPFPRAAPACPTAPDRSHPGRVESCRSAGR